MQNPSDADNARRLAAERRVAEHLSWKKEFFRHRPPPPPIGRLHRRQKGAKGGPSVRLTLKRAREIVLAEAEQRAEEAKGDSTRPRCRAELEDAEKEAEVEEEEATEEPSTKRERWLRRMAEEEGRRNPFLDMNIRSDARRTAIMANLPAQVVEEELRSFADQFGRVVSVRIVRSPKKGSSRRYAFVEFGLPAEAAKAVQFSRKKRLRGHAITIDMERGRTQAGFLPKRMATAKAVRSSSAVSASRADTAAARPGAAGAAGGHDSATSADFDDEEALLNSVLNVGV